jgi:hypothetical protein
MTSNAKRSVVCLFLLLGILPMSALAANQDRIGTAGAQELLIPVGARGVALGPSAMVFSRGAEAIYYNPAGLGRMERSVEAMFSQMSYFADISVSYGAIGVSAGSFGNLGLTIKTLSFGKIAVTNTTFPDGTGEQYSPTYLTLGLTYGKEITDRISVGVTTNLLSEKILSMSASGIAFSIGLQYQNLGIQGLSLGVAVKNIGPNMVFTGSNAYIVADNPNDARGQNPYVVEMMPFAMPSSLEMGIGYSPKLDEKNQLSIGGTFRNNNYQDDEYNLGAEYGFDNMFFVRGGYTFAPETQKDALNQRGYIYDYTMGAGINYTVGGVALTFDYAYRHMKYFDGNQVFTLKLGF